MSGPSSDSCAGYQTNNIFFCLSDRNHPELFVKRICICSIMDSSGEKTGKCTEAVKEDLKESAAAACAQSSRGCCHICVPRFIPSVYRNELVQLSKLAGPVVRLCVNLKLI